MNDRGRERDVMAEAEARVIEDHRPRPAGSLWELDKEGKEMASPLGLAGVQFSRTPD